MHDSNQINHGEFRMADCSSIVVTYFPDAACIEHLKRLAELCNNVIVIDNTPLDKETAFPIISNLTVVKFGENMGLAKGFNKGIKMAGEKDFENIFLFDQDSRVPSLFFADMIKFKERINEKYGPYAIYVPNFRDRNSNTTAKFPILTKWTLRHVKCKDLETIKKDGAFIAITSGSLITYSTYKKIGPLRDDYFIDFLDNEYCLRASRLGFKIYINCDVMLDHSIGKRSKHRFLGLAIKPNHHAPVRRYYISRNGVRTALDYFTSYASFMPLLLARLVHETLSILIYEDNKSRKMKAIVYGIFHGLTGRMGKCPIEQKL